MPYVRGEREWLPTVTLFEGSGDCSDKTTLFAGILNCEPFGTSAAYIRCEFDGEPHMALGVDVRKFGYDPEEVPSNWFTFGPSDEQIANGAPETEYGFIELTDASGSGFGAPDPRRYSVRDFVDTATLDVHERWKKYLVCDESGDDCEPVDPEAELRNSAR